jgi:DNA-binding NarL/FixJ family response regulator
MSSEPIELHRRRAPHKAALEVLHNVSADMSVVDDHSTRGLIIIDRRNFARDCLTAAFRAANGNRPVEAYSDVNELNLKKPGAAAISAVLICLHETAGNEMLVADELRSLSSELPTVPIVLISDFEDVSIVNRALQHGVRGFIPSNLPLKVVLQAIEVVEAGGTYMPIEIFLALRNSMQQAPNAPAVNTENLTARQWAVLQALRQGKANKVIAFELSMRESTVKVHVRNIMKKLNARNRTEVSYMTNGMFNSNTAIPARQTEKVTLRAVSNQLQHA